MLSYFEFWYILFLNISASFNKFSSVFFAFFPLHFILELSQLPHERLWLLHHFHHLINGLWVVVLFRFRLNNSISDMTTWRDGFFEELWRFTSLFRCVYVETWQGRIYGRAKWCSAPPAFWRNSRASAKIESTFPPDIF